MKVAYLGIVIVALIGLAACAGPAGPAGTNGTNGTNGTDGADGTNGTNGANGSNSTSSVLIPSITANGVAVGTGSLVVVANNGYIATSTDGATWTSRTSGSTSSLYSVAYGGTSIVAVGSAGTILRSADGGTTWAPAAAIPAAATGGILYSVSYGAGVFVTVGSTAGGAALLLESADGDSWADHSPASAGPLASVSFANATFFAGTTSGGSLYSSSNGTTWSSAIALSITNSIVGVAYGGGAYLVVDSSGNLMSSTNGSAWSSVYSPNPSTSYYGICYGQDRFALLTGGGTIYWTSDLISWLYPSAILPTHSGNFTAIAWAPFLSQGKGSFVVIEGPAA
jgi:hypothetical protein